jgi:hypothetical protein
MTSTAYLFGRDGAPLVAEVKSRRTGGGFRVIEQMAERRRCAVLRRNRADPLRSAGLGAWEHVGGLLRRRAPSMGQWPSELRLTGMIEPLPRATPVDLLTLAVDHVRPLLDNSIPIGERLRTLWAGTVAARDLGASDVVEAVFSQLARDTGITADLGSQANVDLKHIIRWALLDQNPFA